MLRHRWKWRRSVAFCLALVLGLLSAGPAASAKTDAHVPLAGFADVRGHWAEKDIAEMVQKGGVKGYPDGTFRPDEPVTQEQFMALVLRQLPPFPGHSIDGFAREQYLSGVKGRWSERAYEKLLAAGIIAYGKPDEKINRLQAARILLTALASQSEGEKYRGTKARFFTDIQVSNEYEVITVYPVYKLGVMTGFPDNTFRTEGSLTRAQAVILMKRLQQKIGELYPDNVSAAAKQAMTATVKNFAEDVMDRKKIRRYEDLVRYVQEKKLPVTTAFLEEHFSFMKYDGIDFARFPYFDELLYFARIGEHKYRLTVQYYSGELAGSLDKTFYFSSRDGKTFQLIGKNE